MRSMRTIWVAMISFVLGAVSGVLVGGSRSPADRTIVVPETPAPASAVAGASITAAPAPRDCAQRDRQPVPADVRRPPDDDDAIDYLRQQHIQIPLAGVSAKDLHGSFRDARGGSRRHEAIDILAPRNTPIRAVDDGCVARLFESKAGGLTIYQFDPTVTYTYYYAHLERYADELEEGEAVRKGQILGYVGTSGNAPPDTPHLHFAIFILGIEKHWWEGTPIDPYDVWKD